MISKGPRKLIRYENFYPRTGTSSDRRENRRYHQFQGPKNNSAGPHPVNEFSTGLNLDDQLRVHEHCARLNFLKIKNALGFEKLPGWLGRMLDRRILPTLDRTGCDQQIARTLFELAPSAWKRMGPVNDKIIAFHPAITLELEKVLQGLGRQVNKNNDGLPRLGGAAPAFKTGTINHRGSPEHLFELLVDIPTPWITLPRTFRFLEKDHCRYLPHYVKTIDRETSESCLKLFSRITMEFIANFTLKFAGRHNPPDQIEKLLFYGYSAMYWQTLRRPPINMENSAVFDHSLNWISRLIRQRKFLRNEAVPSIDRMLKMQSEIFPISNINRPQPPGRHGNSRFVVTLRHGAIGVETILKYLGIDQFQETRRILGQFPLQFKENELLGLLYTIQTHYHLESRRTRGYIQQFLGHLKSAYEKSSPAAHRPEKKFLFRMINNLQILFTN